MTLLLVLKATTVLVVALALARAGGMKSAALRHLLLCGAFAALALLPAAISALPPVTYVVPVHPVATGPAAPLDIELPDAFSQRVQSNDDSPLRSSFQLPVWIALWMGVSIVTLWPLVASCFHMRRLALSGQPWPDGQALAARLRDEAGVRRSVLVLRHDSVSGPFTFGVRQPIIFFPSDVSPWSGAALDAALRHELEHIRRFDWLFLCLARGICAVYWFHPLVWTAWRRLRLEAEQACDDAVLRATNAREYAALLIRVAEQWLSPGAMRWPAMASPGDLAVRVRQVLSPNAERSPLRNVSIALCAIAVLAISAILGPLTIAAYEAQSPIAPNLTFEATSIKPNRSGSTSSSTDTRPGGQFVMSNGTIRTLLLNAYGPQSTEIVGVPDWVNTERFDVLATANATTTADQIRSMLKSLLVERFMLSARIEPREQPVFFLTLAHDDGRLGPNLERTPRDCASVAAATRAGLPAPTLTPPQNGAPPCGMRAAGGELLGGGISMDLLARNLGARAGRIVIDRTGLQGIFDFTLRFSRDQNLDSDAPSIFTALQEQLGLKLDAGRAPLTTLVVDHIERPSEN